MMDWDLVNTAVNVFFMVLFWVWADDAFERDTPFIGYLYIFISAANGASIGAKYL